MHTYSLFRMCGLTDSGKREEVKTLSSWLAGWLRRYGNTIIRLVERWGGPDGGVPVGGIHAARTGLVQLNSAQPAQAVIYHGK
jgi:hypothetical protein